MPKDIFEYIKQQETQYAQQHEVLPNWSWSMKEHIEMCLSMKHGQFIKATNELSSKQPKKNVVYPMQKLRYRAEDIDLKDVLIYVNSDEKYHLSFLIKKYHDDVYVVENDLDSLFDSLKVEKIDLGLTLARKGAKGPVVEKLETIAFCDPTDIMAGPIGFKSLFSPDQLMEQAAIGWGDPANGADITLDELVELSEQAQKSTPNSQTIKTPGKKIEVYRVHGSMPSHWLQDDPKRPNKERYTRQLQVVAFYDSPQGFKTGVTLYKKKEYESPFKSHTPEEKLRNRAVSYGGIEILFDAQVWTDYSNIRKRDILDAVSKVVNVTDDPTFANRNKIREMENNQILTIQQGSRFERLRTDAPNIQLFNEWIQEWQVVAQDQSGATDTLQGKQDSAGDPFRAIALKTQNGMGQHEYYRGRFASFIAEIYRDWIIPDIAKKVTQGAKFLSTLSPDEMEYVADCVVRSETNKMVKEKILMGADISPEDVMLFEQMVRDQFVKGGNKKFIEILKDEFKDIELSVKVNVAGKQKDLASIADRMSNVWRQIFANPQLLNDPKAVKVLNKLLEYSGIDPIDFGYIPSTHTEEQQPPAGQLPSPIQPTQIPAPTSQLV